jgi:hypothetical protein
MSFFELLRGTTENSFSIGDGANTVDKKIEVNNWAEGTNRPYIRHNHTSHRWEFSDDGIEFYVFAPATNPSFWGILTAEGVAVNYIRGKYGPMNLYGTLVTGRSSTVNGPGTVTVAQETLISFDPEVYHGTHITGLGTNFTGYFVVGDTITVTSIAGTRTGTISAIYSDTSLLLSSGILSSHFEHMGTNPEDPFWPVQEFYTAPTKNVLTALASGNVGIGITAPTEKLEVVGKVLATTARLTNLTDGYLPYHVSDVLGLANSGLFWDGTHLGIDVTSLAEKLEIAGKVKSTTTILTNLTVGYIPFHALDASGLANSGLYWDGARLGIGTATPSALLDVYKAGVGVSPVFRSMGSSDAAINSRVLNEFVGGRAAALAEDIILRAHAYDDIIGGITLKNSGKLGIGTVTPDQRLDVKGSISVGRIPLTTYTGLRRWDGQVWDDLNAAQPELIATVGQSMFVSFAAYGVYTFQNDQWIQLSATPAIRMAATTTTLFVHQAGVGIYSVNVITGAWTLISPGSPTLMVASATLLFANFTGVGIKSWNGTTWVLITPNEAALMTASDTKLYIMASPGSGATNVYKWDGAVWTEVFGSSSGMVSMVASSTTIYGSFPGSGIYGNLDNGTAWFRVNSGDASKIYTYGDVFYGSFSVGLYQLVGAIWTRLNTAPATVIHAGGGYVYASFAVAGTGPGYTRLIGMANTTGGITQPAGVAMVVDEPGNVTTFLCSYNIDGFSRVITLTPTGAVGIGTNFPTAGYKLDILGNLILTGDSPIIVGNAGLRLFAGSDSAYSALTVVSNGDVSLAYHNTIGSNYGRLRICGDGYGTAVVSREIDFLGTWAEGEGKAITAGYAGDVANMVAQQVFEYNSGGRIKFGRFYVSGNSAVYPIMMVGKAAGKADLTVDGNVEATGDVKSGGVVVAKPVAFLDKGDSGTTTQNLAYTAAEHQRIRATGNFTITTSGWPVSGLLGEILLELVGDGTGRTITWPTINWIKSDGTLTTTFGLNGVTLVTANNAPNFCLLWTRDAGTTIYGKWMR